MAFRAAALTLAATLLFLVPAASAHTAIYSADGLVRGSVGLLNEPVSTYAVTGLDVCFTQNVTASPRPAVNVANAGDFTATVRAPNGSTHSEDLSVPFGKPNCLTFAKPLVLTQPGQYLVDLSGSINGTTFGVTGIKAGGEVRDRAEITFPDEAVPSDKALADQVAALQQRIGDLEAQVQQMREASETETSSDASNEFAPGAPATLLMLGLAGLVAVLRRKA